MLFSTLFLLAQSATPPAVTDVQPTLESVVVTARRKPELAAKAPISVDQLSGEAVAKADLKSLDAIAKALPSLTYRAIFGASAPQFFIRGVGSNDINPNGNPGVAVYLGDVLIASPIGQNLALFDLSAIEVAKGPQGTLFGRNATGGAIRLIAQKPLAEDSASVTLRVGDFARRDVEAVYNTGNEDIAARIAIFGRFADGFVRNLAQNSRESDTEATGVRASARLQLAENWQADVSVDKTQNRSGMRAHRGIGLLPGGTNALGYIFPTDPYRQSYDRADREYVDTQGASFTLAFDGALRFESITSHRTADREVRDDADASPQDLIGLNFDNQTKQYSQEFRLLGDTDALSWQAGLYYLSDDIRTVNGFDVLGIARSAGAPFNPQRGPFFLQQQYGQDVTSRAVYGEGDYTLSPNLTLTLGARHTRESVDFVTATYFNERGLIPLGPPRSGAANNSANSWRTALSYAANDRVNLFGSVSRGFKSGGFNGGALFPSDDIGPLRPEFVTAFEVGGTWALNDDSELRASAFRYNYSDLQVFTLVAAQPTYQSKESADATMHGVELRLRSQLSSRLKVRSELAWLNARFSEFIDANRRNLSGNRLTASPEWAGFTGLEWDLAEFANWGLSFRGDINFRSRIYFDGSERAVLSAPARSFVNLGLALQRDELGIALDVSNALDKAELVDVLDFAEYGFLQQTFGPPRRISLALNWKF